MGRVPCCDKEGLKKGPWTPEEDQKLVDYIQKHGPGRWKSLPKNAGLYRCGKSCRLRWTNYLRPDIKRGKFSFEEEETIIQLHSTMGNKWSAIAARLPGRTDNEIKNYWNTHIRKRLLNMGIDPVTHSPRLDILQLASFLNAPLLNSSQSSVSNLLGSLLDPNVLNLATALLSSQLSNQELILQKLQENQIGNYTQFSQQDQLNQIQSILQKQLQSIQPCPTSNNSSAQLLNVEQLCPNNNANFSCQSQPNMWQASEELPSLVASPIPSSFNSDFFLDNKDNVQDLSFSSLLNTSSSTHASGSSTEDTERESYCSNMLMFDTPDSFDMHGICDLK